MINIFDNASELAIQKHSRLESDVLSAIRLSVNAGERYILIIVCLTN